MLASLLRAEDALFEELSKVIFYSNGTARAEHQYVDVPLAVSYNEPDNVTCSMCQWSTGSWTYPFINTSNPAPAPMPCKVSVVSHDTDMIGNDLSQHKAPATSDACAGLCCDTRGCEAWLFEPKSDIQMGDCEVGGACCFLKSKMGVLANSKPGAVAGRTNGGVVPPSPEQFKNPPLGIRSAPQLGGVSTGSVELRADGSLRDWTLLNQGPAGSGKYGIVDDAWMAVRVARTLQTKTKVLRTHPPAYLRGQGVSQLTFSGTYPVTKLALADAELALADDDHLQDTPLSLFAYSTLRPTDLEGSAYPAIVFTLAAENTGHDPMNVSFMLHLPFAAMTDCARRGDGKGGDASSVHTHADCLHACHATSKCNSWHFDVAPATCTLNSDVPLTAHSVGSYCGLRGQGWSVDGTALSLSQWPTHNSTSSSAGSVTLRPVGGEAVSFDVGDDPAKLFANFQSTGSLGGSTLNGIVAANAAAVVSATVAPGAKTTVSIVFAWHFPNRDFSGDVLGNGYANLWPDSAAVAADLATQEALRRKVVDINKHHNAIASRENPSPDWLKDMLVNQWSHLHMMMWYKDGRIREYEAHSCDDVDSVHNDYQRHLLYLWAYPRFEVQKLEAWGSWAQAADGHVEEMLAWPGTPMDDPIKGRLMGDTTSLFLLELYEFWRNTGDSQLARRMWPSARRALDWMIGNAMGSIDGGIEGFGIPQKVQTTYDHFGWDGRRAVAYNAHIYLTALKAVEKMAEQLGDRDVEQRCIQMVQAAMVALPRELWNSTYGFFRAHNEGNQIFTDTLYGQMLAHHNFGNMVYDNMSQLWTHLDFEWTQNQDLYGMRVLSNLDGNPPQEDSIWMNGPPTWTYLQLTRRLANPPAAPQPAPSMEEAMEPFKRMSENFRTRLNDPWNLRALTNTQTAGTELEHGAPREQGHYGFMLTDLYLLPLLSGLRADLAQVESKQTLHLSPLFAPPFVLPVLLSGCEGTLRAVQSENGAVRFTLSVAFGKLKLPPNSLCVCSVMQPDAVALEEDEELSWSQDDVSGCMWPSTSQLVFV